MEHYMIEVMDPKREAEELMLLGSHMEKHGRSIELSCHTSRKFRWDHTITYSVQTHISSASYSYALQVYAGVGSW